MKSDSALARPKTQHWKDLYLTKQKHRDLFISWCPPSKQKQQTDNYWGKNWVASICWFCILNHQICFSVFIHSIRRAPNNSQVESLMILFKLNFINLHLSVAVVRRQRISGNTIAWDNYKKNPFKYIHKINTYIGAKLDETSFLKSTLQ